MCKLQTSSYFTQHRIQIFMLFVYNQFTIIGSRRTVISEFSLRGAMFLSFFFYGEPFVCDCVHIISSALLEIISTFTTGSVNPRQTTACYKSCPDPILGQRGIVTHQHIRILQATQTLTIQKFVFNHSLESQYQQHITALAL